MKKVVALFLFLVWVLTTGCIVGDEANTLYIEADGSVTWMVLGQDLRSDEEDLEKRRQEEEELLRDAQAMEHSAAEFLRALGPLEMESYFLRRERPYVLVTQARFASLETLLRALLDHEGEEDAVVEVTTHGPATQLLMILDPEAAGAAVEGGEESRRPEPEADRDVECWDEFRLVLSQGRFTDAIGFEIRGEEDVAVLCESDTEEFGTEFYHLRWTTAG